MKQSLLHKSPPSTTLSTKTAQMPPSRTASSPHRPKHTMSSSDGTDYGASSSSNATSKHMK